MLARAGGISREISNFVVSLSSYRTPKRTMDFLASFPNKEVILSDF